MIETCTKGKGQGNGDEGEHGGGENGGKGAQQTAKMMKNEEDKKH